MSGLTPAPVYYPPTGPGPWHSPGAGLMPAMGQMPPLNALVPKIDANNLGEMTRRGAGSLPAITGARAAAENARQVVGMIADDTFRGSMRVASRQGMETYGRAASWGARSMQGPLAGGGMAGSEFGARSISLGGAARGTFFSFGAVGRALVSSALFAVPSALITNYIDWKAGRINDHQRNVLIVADSSGYTVVGATATLLGGAVGATIFGPGVAAIVGIGAALGLGWVYEKYIRPRWAAFVAGFVPPPNPVPPPLPKMVMPPAQFPMDPSLLPK